VALNHRIGRLEARARASTLEACPECGNGPGAPVTVHIAGPEVVATMVEAREAGEQPGDRCAACGLKIVYRLPPPEPARARR